MKALNFKIKILIYFLIIVLFLGISVFTVVLTIINNNIIHKAQNELKTCLRSARSIYDEELRNIKLAFELFSWNGNPGGLEEFKKKAGLDYLVIADRDHDALKYNEIVRSAFKGKKVSGNRIMTKKELIGINNELYKKVRMEVKYTPRGRKVEQDHLNEALVMEYARPVKNNENKTVKVIYGGRIINKYFTLVDKIRDLLFEHSFFEDIPMGTVTIFQHDIRITTNVLDKEKNRAIGTKVSEQVYEEVLQKGKRWFQRAFVVSHWYMTGYEPIKDINGKIIGMLYVGLLEKPFLKLKKDFYLLTFGIILICIIAAVLISFLFSASISRA
ncbi:MAG: cache domain-containing protein, partial [Spirochaetes bacterium]|nr:cache domain-containing protein [Spirochaetota bacterium]